MLTTRPNVALPTGQVHLYSFDNVEVLTAQHIVLLYMVDRAIGEAEWKEAVKAQVGYASVALVKVSPLGQYRRETLNYDDWKLAEEINREIWQKLKLVFDQRPSGYPDLHLFLYAPLPLAFHLGAIIRDRASLFVYQGNREGHFHLIKRPSQSTLPDTQQYWHVKNLPIDSSPQKGEVPIAISISVTHIVNVTDVGVGITLSNEKTRYLEIVEMFRTGGNGHNVLGNEIDVLRACEEFRSVTDQIRDIWPNRSGLHIFYAGPVSLAFLLGQTCHLDLHPQFIFYQHEHNQYTPILQFGKDDELPVQREAIDDAAQKQALMMLSKFRTVYESLQTEVKNGKFQIPTGFANSNEKTKRRLLNSNIITDQELTVTGERPFFFDHSLRQKWIFDAYFLLGFDRAKRENRFDSEQELDDAIRIFFLHELVHPDQLLTSRNALNIGRAGLVLEAADYDADVFAFEGALDWYRQFNPKEIQQLGENKILARLIKTALRVMALFDEAEQGGYPVKTMAIRRLRRYLIWHFQRVRSEMNSAISVTVSNLRQRPAIEITFLTEQVDRERFQNFISSDRLHRDERMELAAYFGERIYRWAGIPGGHNPLDLVYAILKGEDGWEEIAEIFAYLFEQSWMSVLPNQLD